MWRYGSAIFNPSRIHRKPIQTTPLLSCRSLMVFPITFLLCVLIGPWNTSCWGYTWTNTKQRSSRHHRRDKVIRWFYTIWWMMLLLVPPICKPWAISVCEAPRASYSPPMALLHTQVCLPKNVHSGLNYHSIRPPATIMVVQLILYPPIIQNPMLHNQPQFTCQTQIGPDRLCRIHGSVWHSGTRRPEKVKVSNFQIYRLWVP
jgi:hypothetical protein